MPFFYPENNRILPSDNELRSLHKIASLSGAGSSGGSGGGAITAMQVYIDRAPAFPDNPDIAALNYASGGSSIQQWDVNTLAWI